MTPVGRYEDWVMGMELELGADCGVREEEAGSVAAAATERGMVSEREVQAGWFAGEFGRVFRTVAGDRVEVVQFGEWNREAGPDFRGAAVSINGGAPVAGCIEIDPDVRDWERHGHAVNPAYEDVMLHVFWNVGSKESFTRTPAGHAVPQVKLDVTALARVAGLARQSQESVPTARPGRCAAVFARMSPAQIADFLAEAAYFRLRRKARRIAVAAEIHGEYEAPYQFLAEALGYKSNKLPFLLLAQRLPVRRLRRLRTASEAVLFGTSGFLTAATMDCAQTPPLAKNYLRQLWDMWWRRRPEYENLVVSPAKLWNCRGGRPANHPQRRVAALAEIARHWPSTRAALRSGNPAKIRRHFSGLRHEFWDRHYTLTSRPSRGRMALVGVERVEGIVINVALPMALRENPSVFERMRKLAAPGFNARVRNASLRLFGVEASAVPLLKMSVHQQGLLQIADDFCRRDISNCQRCPLHEQLCQWR